MARGSTGNESNGSDARECPQVSRKQRKMRRVGQSTALRQHADHPRHVWSWDFVEDQTENGSRFRILTVIDEYTRQWLNFYLAHSIRTDDVITVLAETMAKHGTPEYIRSDNGLAHQTRISIIKIG